MEMLTNFELGCLAVALLLVAPELCALVRELAKEDR